MTVVGEDDTAIANGDPFMLLPDEVVMLIAVATDDVCAMACLERTCRRMRAIVLDDATWRMMYLRHHGGPAPHERFAEFGRDWRWLYRTRLPSRGKAGRSVGLVAGALSGRTYMGDLHGLSAHGYGRASWADRSKSKCESKNAPNAETYEGQWFHDVMHGRGACTWHNGDRYDGEWRQGKRNGCGVYTWSSGTRYEGDWVGGKMHGRGLMVYPSGDRYEGDYAEDKRHGRGVYRYAGGNVCDGDWLNGERQQ